MQSLADDGYTFRRMYVQQALCSPSRTVLLTGRRPDRSHVWTIGPYFRDTVGQDWITLPQAFKNAGFVTAGAGKLFHPGGKRSRSLCVFFRSLKQRLHRPVGLPREGRGRRAHGCAERG